jgi:hypothetical protein
MKISPHSKIEPGLTLMSGETTHQKILDQVTTVRWQKLYPTKNAKLSSLTMHFSTS